MIDNGADVNARDRAGETPLAVARRHLQEKMAAPDFFQRDPGAFQAAADRLQTAEAALQAAEERWLELEILREDLAAGKT